MRSRRISKRVLTSLMGLVMVWGRVTFTPITGDTSFWDGHWPRNINDGEAVNCLKDGSKIDNDDGFTVCILKDYIAFKNYCFKLKHFNSVFHAEIAATNFAVGWTLKNNSKINIPTDSESSIETLRSSRPRSEFVNKIKNNIRLAGWLVDISGMQAHVGNPGNERADHYAKTETISGKEMASRLPILISNSKLKEISKKNGENIGIIVTQN
ncbi:hypothetical protein AVEN_72823-1 [Araneus ventricosus]|uniref:RNase H type-1 domain-containing protein n=1 Tax=Araneus ventricosus TaxID=182803 RepID=A0A4Y2FEB6_ARAVE|nr:hypothetical protein AVEN_72823-1 [Araneus ventricosus]